MPNADQIKKGDTEDTKNKNNLYFRAGIFIMAFSFLVYLLYPLIPFLPYSAKFKVFAAVAVSGAAWATFAVGFAISGKEGYKKIKDFAKGYIKKRITD